MSSPDFYCHFELSSGSARIPIDQMQNWKRQDYFGTCGFAAAGFPGMVFTGAASAGLGFASCKSLSVTESVFEVDLNLVNCSVMNQPAFSQEGSQSKNCLLNIGQLFKVQTSLLACDM